MADTQFEALHQARAATIAIFAQYVALTELWGQIRGFDPNSKSSITAFPDVATAEVA
ncbi:hypothetical protein [Cypionkella sp.]|uniref:hypothetical protein n=1 Tax=Cypionkella sp. TaxID=2811411 RepID=UPI002606A779|nr:hypothetical protein [Cypionkella sp.]